MSTQAKPEQIVDDDTMYGISDDELTKRFCEAIRLENEAKKAINCPIAQYDSVNKRAYLKFSDGHCEYIQKA